MYPITCITLTDKSKKLTVEVIRSRLKDHKIDLRGINVCIAEKPEANLLVISISYRQDDLLGNRVAMAVFQEFADHEPKFASLLKKSEAFNPPRTVTKMERQSSKSQRTWDTTS
jgi:hypothetical protein